MQKLPSSGVLLQEDPCTISLLLKAIFKNRFSIGWMKTPKLIRVMIRNKVVVGLKLAFSKWMHQRWWGVSLRLQVAFCISAFSCFLVIYWNHVRLAYKETWEPTWGRAEPFGSCWQPSNPKYVRGPRHNQQNHFPSPQVMTDAILSQPEPTEPSNWLTDFQIIKMVLLLLLWIPKSQTPDHMMIGGMVSDKEE